MNQTGDGGRIMTADEYDELMTRLSEAEEIVEAMVLAIGPEVRVDDDGYALFQSGIEIDADVWRRAKAIAGESYG